jgi:hypothetical protein
MGVLDSIGSGAEAGANFLGHLLNLPIVSPLLELPRMVHDQSRNAQAEKAKEQYLQSAGNGTGAQSGGLQQIPSGPSAGQPVPQGGAGSHGQGPTLQVPVATMAHLIHKAGGLAALHGSMGPQGGSITGIPGAVDTSVNTQGMGAQPTGSAMGLPKPEAQLFNTQTPLQQPMGQPHGQQPTPQIPQGQTPPPTMPPVSPSKQFRDQINKIYSPETLSRLSKEDPTQYKKIMAMRGIANYDQGNASAAMTDLMSAGVPATQAIAILQEQRNQKSLTKFHQKLAEGSPPAQSPAQTAGSPAVTQPPQITREDFIKKNIPLLNSVGPAGRAQAYRDLIEQSQAYPLAKDAGSASASQQIPSFLEGLSQAKTPQEVQKLIADQVSKLPPGARAPFSGMTKPYLDNWQKSYSASQKDSSLTGPALDLMAKQYLATGSMPSFGMGGQRQKEAVANRAAEIAKQEQLSPSDVIFNQREIKAGSQALGQIQKSQGMIMQYESTANRNADIALAESEKTTRSGEPVFNRWLMAGRTAVGGDAQVARFNAANQTFGNEYAKVMSGGYGAAATSDSARQEALSMLNTAQTPEQYRSVIGLLKQEMRNRMKAMAETRTFLENGIRMSAGGKSKGPGHSSELKVGAKFTVPGKGVGTIISVEP